jgi:hypothetical protein
MINTNVREIVIAKIFDILPAIIGKVKLDKKVQKKMINKTIPPILQKIIISGLLIGLWRSISPNLIIRLRTSGINKEKQKTSQRAEIHTKKIN